MSGAATLPAPLHEARIAVVNRALPPEGGMRGPVTEALAGLGADARIVADGSEELASADLLWFVGNANWFPRSWPRLQALPRERRPPVVFWQTEPLPLPRTARLRSAPPHLRELAKIVLRDPRRTDPRSNFAGLRRVSRRGLPDVLVVSTFERKLFLQEHGIASEFVPLGYDPVAHGRDLGLERDVDVLFLGALDVPRRRRIFRGLERDGIEVHAVGSWTDKSFWGENRIRLLNRAKILLNISRHPGMLSGGRMLLGMATKALVVAEPIFEPRPYVPGTHYVSCALDQLATTVSRLLEDGAERERITSAAHAFVTTELTMRDSVARIAALAGRI